MNRAFRKQSGIDLGLSAYSDVYDWGKVGLDLRYSHILNTEIQEIASEYSTLNENFRDDISNNEIRTRSNFTLSWASENWGSALSIFRKGSFPKSDGSGRLSSWYTANLMIKRKFLDDNDFILTIRNLTNERPPIDDSFGTWPYFFRGQYDAVGREFFAEINMKF